MIIFIDIDGVMVPIKSWQAPKMLTDGFMEFSQNSIMTLQNIINKYSDITLIITSSHKGRFTINQWINIFEKRNIKINKIEILESDFITRIDQIVNYLETINEENFLIIDDDTSLNDLPKHLKQKLILTKPMLGLIEQDLYEYDNR